MSRKISKLLILLLTAVIIFSFSVCFANEVDSTILTTTSQEEASASTEETSNQTTPELHQGDLYLFGTDIVMDKLVDGNAFIFGTNVTITGQVNGNLFVFANTLKFDNSTKYTDYNCYVRYSIFACANSVYYNAACNDLYVATNNLEMTYDSYVIRDVKAVASDVIFKAAVGRDFDLSCGKINFGEGEELAVVYGNMRYSAPSEATIPEGVFENVETQVTYNPVTEEENTVSVGDIVVRFLAFVVTILVIYALTKLCVPQFIERINNTNLSALELLKDFGIGLLATLIICIVFFILLFTTIGWKLAIIVALLFVIALLVSVPYFAVAVTNAFVKICKADSTLKFYLLLSLVSIILLGISYIPFVGGLISFVISFIALGMFFRLFLPRKELSEDEKKQIEEAKQQAKELKEKKKQEKAQKKESSEND